MRISGGTGRFHKAATLSTTDLPRYVITEMAKSKEPGGKLDIIMEIL
jgi:hypothetical protein